jgi:hypothetical protein
MVVPTRQYPLSSKKQQHLHKIPVVGVILVVLLILLSFQGSSFESNDYVLILPSSLYSSASTFSSSCDLPALETLITSPRYIQQQHNINKDQTSSRDLLLAEVVVLAKAELYLSKQYFDRELAYPPELMACEQELLMQQQPTFQNIIVKHIYL